jgi:NIPSNAP protein
MKPVYEVVSGSILLSKREDFFRLHRDWLLPMMHKIGIRPVLLLMTEIGSYGKFLDIYRYDSLAQYEELTDRLLSHPELQSYYVYRGVDPGRNLTYQEPGRRSRPCRVRWTCPFKSFSATKASSASR